MTRVLMVVPYDLCSPGGVRSHAAGLSRALARKGWGVTLLGFASCRPLPRDLEGLEVVDVSADDLVVVPAPVNRSVGRVGLLGPAAQRRLEAFMKGRHFDVVHVHEPLVPGIGPQVLALSHSVNIATFHAYPDDIISRLIQVLGFRLGVWGLDKIDGCISVSYLVREWVRSNIRTDCRVIPNGIEFARFAGPREPRSKPTVLFVGRLERRKGADVLIKAFARVKRTVPAARLEIVGDGPMRAELENLVRDLVPSDVEFAGSVSDEELIRRYHQAWVFCAPAVGGESFGIVLLEAMASGLPVVASDIPGYREVADRYAPVVPPAAEKFEPGRALKGPDIEPPSGPVLFFPPGDWRTLAEELEFLLSRPEWRDALGRRGREWAVRFDWDAVAEKVVEVYRLAPANRY